MPGGKIYLRDGESLVAMTEAPYDAEDILQALLADYPDLLAGDQMQPTEPRRWLLISREVGVPDVEGGQARWSLDHLFIDQDAIPTLVEVKRSSDTRLRREVVGQMLDYAANVVAYWPGAELRRLFDERPRSDDDAPDEEVLALIGKATVDEPDAADAVDEFWQQAMSNLAARRIRLVFVADVIPRELQRIVEFLNENLVRAEVLAVEVKQFVGEGRQTLVPRVIGRTAAAEDVKQASRGAKPVARTWTKDEFVEAASAIGGAGAHSLVQAALAWAARHGVDPIYGKGKFGPLYLTSPGTVGDQVRIVNINTQGLTMVQFDVLSKWPPFDTVEERIELNDRLNRIAGVNIAERYAVDATWPSIHVEVLESDEAQAALFEVLDWAASRLSGRP